MKRFSIILGAFVMAASAFAESPLSGGVEAGLNLSSSVDATQVSPGFRIGVFGELRLPGKWYLDAALRFTSKPWKHSETEHSGEMWDENLLWRKTSVSATPYFLELPIHAGMKYGITDNLKFTWGVGPYFGVGLFGKGKYSQRYKSNEIGAEPVITKEDISNIYKDGEYGMKRFEIGVDAKIGLEIKNHYIVGIGYQFQFNNPEKKYSMSPAGKSQVFSINVGYRF